MDPLKKQIISYYQEAVKLAPVHEDLKRALNVEGQYPNFVENFYQNVKKSRKPITASQLKDSVYSFTKMFLDLCEEKNRQMRMSEAAKAAERLKTDKERLANKIADTIMEGGTVGEELLDT